MSISKQTTKRKSYMNNIYTFFFKQNNMNSSAESYATTSSDSTGLYYDVIEEDEFTLVDDMSTITFPRLLYYLQQQPLMANKIEHEFAYIAGKIKELCHSLDIERPSTQYAKTSAAIGDNLVLAAKFISQRYHDDAGDSWLALMGLLVIGLQTMETLSEVKRELINTTKIGRVLILEMSKLLKFMKRQVLGDRLRLAIVQIVLDGRIGGEEQAWFPLLQTFCKAMVELDKTWNFQQEYNEVVAIAASSFMNM